MNENSMIMFKNPRQREKLKNNQIFKKCRRYQIRIVEMLRRIVQGWEDIFKNTLPIRMKRKERREKRKEKRVMLLTKNSV